ncbi:winged helix-turn-helix transcriptional regulator [Paenibacillus timonensis]|uniref:winged helix-turn-helix transcriptional regulator n=1 Tax=Paenibacillus timonensis TaxID=225915 RepID=UPI003F9C3A19
MLAQVRSAFCPSGWVFPLSLPNPESTLEIFAGKWKLVILFRLSSNGMMRFYELQRAIPDITQKSSRNIYVNWSTITEYGKESQA